MVYLGKLKMSLKDELKKQVDDLKLNEFDSSVQTLLLAIIKACKDAANQKIYSCSYYTSEFSSDIANKVVNLLKEEPYKFDCFYERNDYGKGSYISVSWK